MRRVRLRDGTRAWCLERFEALALDAHVAGYLAHGVDVRAGDVVFDVGANIGLFALRLLQRFRGDVTIATFEPVPDIHAVLERNLEPWSGDRVHAMRCALSRAAGELEITYYPSGPALSTAHPALWSDQPDQLAAAVRGGARHAPPGMRWGAWLPDAVLRVIARRLVRAPEKRRCEMRTVSDVMGELALDRIDLLKVDVEGAELEVLEGVAADDWPRIRQVVAEVHDVDGRLATIVALLRGHGFTHVITEQEPAFEGTWLHNLWARR